MKHEILFSAPPIIRDFLTYSESIRGKSSNSIDEYYHDLQTFFRYIKMARRLDGGAEKFEDISIEDVDINLIRTVTLSDT